MQGPSQTRFVSWHCAPLLSSAHLSPHPWLPRRGQDPAAQALPPPAQTARWAERGIRTRTEVGPTGVRQGERVRRYVKNALISQIARPRPERRWNWTWGPAPAGEDWTSLHTLGNERSRSKHRPSDPKPGALFFFKEVFHMYFFFFPTSMVLQLQLQLNFR